MKFQRDKLMQLRKSRKWSRATLGQASGLSGQAIWKIESGRTESPDTGTVNALAAALEVSPLYFFDEATNQGKQAV